MLSDSSSPNNHAKTAFCRPNRLLDTLPRRLWDANFATTQFGSWWALGKPAGSREAYRQDYAICPSWSALNRLTSCTVKLGTVIVIGSTQSVQCEDGTFAVSPSSQVFMQNNAAAGQLAVENCQDEGQWP